MSKENILVMFGGVSPEHEVSIISGLQILEEIDQEKYRSIPIYQEKNGNLKILLDYKGKRDFLKVTRRNVSFGRDKKGGYIKFGFQKIYPYCACLAYHGGLGECGGMQGLLQTCGIPITSPDVESSVISSHKGFAKLFAQSVNIPILKFKNLFSGEIKNNLEQTAEDIEKEFSYPLIVKPVHLGSSIGIRVVKNEGDLLRALSSVSLLDTEMIVEKCLKDFNEYNCSVIKIDNKFQFSAIEKPLRQSEILTFDNKYQDKNRSKNGNNEGGMANLARELPAKIDDQTEERIKEYAKDIYSSCRCNGVVRIDFIEDSRGIIYFNELNRIPGSMAFYLWEAKGLDFTSLISMMINEAVERRDNKDSFSFDYDTDIVETFINNINH